ncbi:MAG: hypothetical protein R3B70_01715 [Polyangiaceae bacterium]
MDNGTGFLVSILDTKPSYNEEADYRRLLDDIGRQQQQVPPAEGFVHILATGSQWPQPNAMWRKRFAEAREKQLYPVHFALISPSPIVRGVVTAVSWVAPPKTGSSTAWSSFDEAVEAIESRFKRRLPILQKLYEEASVRAK